MYKSGPFSNMNSLGVTCTMIAKINWNTLAVFFDCMQTLQIEEIVSSLVKSARRLSSFSQFRIYPRLKN